MGLYEPSAGNRGHKKGLFKDESYPMESKPERPGMFDTDETPGDYFHGEPWQAQARLQKDGSVTAGNASGLNDGGSCLIRWPRKGGDGDQQCTVVASAPGSVEPQVMGRALVGPLKNCPEIANLELRDIDYFAISMRPLQRRSSAATAS